MNTFSYQVLYPSAPLHPPSEVDWLDCAWGGPYYDDDLPEALCGSWSCPGDCTICCAAEQAMRRIFLPIQGPVNRDGIPLGYLILAE